MRGDTLAEGIAVKAPGRITQAIVRRLVDDIVLVSEQEIERAVSLLINIEKTVVEGAGAAGLAAVLKQPRTVQGPHARPRAVRRQHRHAAAGERADARACPRGAADPARHRSRGSAGHARQGRQHPGRGRRQHRRGLPPARVLATCRPRARCSRWSSRRATASTCRRRSTGSRRQASRSRCAATPEGRADGCARRARPTGDAADWRRLNRANWDERVRIHLASRFNDRARLRDGSGAAAAPSRRPSSGRWRACASLHLQMPFGMDTLKLAQRGAEVRGPRLLRPAIDAARGWPRSWAWMPGPLRRGRRLRCAGRTSASRTPSISST